MVIHTTMDLFCKWSMVHHAFSRKYNAWPRGPEMLDIIRISLLVCSQSFCMYRLHSLNCGVWNEILYSILSEACKCTCMSQTSKSTVTEQLYVE